MMNDERSASAAIAGAEQSVHRSSFIIQHSPVERFAFPELAEPREQPPATESPKVVWPACSDTETAWACADTADGILRQLSLERPTVVAFTSPGEGDGKTSLLIALAPELAKRVAGSVLVVDANFRRPNLTARLSMPAALGWGDSCTAAPGATVQLSPRQETLIYPTNLPKLNVLPAPACWGGNGAAAAGATVQPSPQQGVQPSSQQMGSQFRGFDRSSIEELREGRSLVLLDAASLVHPEVAPMAHCCDGVYLVVRLGHTARRAVAEAARVIRASGGRLLGCVVVN